MKYISSPYYKALASDKYISCNCAAAVKFILPSSGDSITIKKVDASANAITICPDKGQSLDNATLQVETATVIGAITGSGDATIVVTAAGMPGSPLTVSVPVLNGDAIATTGLKIRNALNSIVAITDMFIVSGTAANIVFTQIEPSGNDATLNISIDNGTCTGLTTAGTSTNTTAGVAVTIASQNEYATFISNGTSWAIADKGGVNVTETLTNKTLTIPVINQPTLRLASATLPLNAAAATVDMLAALTALIAVGDTVEFGGATFTMVAANPGATEFTNVAGLTVLINALADYNAANDSGKVTITAAVKGATRNGAIAATRKAVGSTAGGAVAAKATVTIAAATLAQLAVGDAVLFDTVAYEKHSSTDVPTHKFADTAGLISCLDATADWVAAASGSDIVITAATNGAAFNDKTVVAVYLRTTAGGQNGTVGAAGEIKFDASNIYICTATNTIADANWKAAALS